MAVTKRYYKKWQVPGHANQSYLNIYDLENTAFGWGFLSTDPKELTIQSGGVSISYEGREDTVFEPVKTSTLTLNLIIENDDQAKIVEATKDTAEFNLALEYGHVVSGAEVAIWRGVLAPQSVQVDYGIHPYAVKLTFTDGLALLAEKAYRDPDDNIYEDGAPMRVHLSRAMQYLPTWPLFDSAETGLHYCTDIFHDNHNFDTTDALPDKDVLINCGCNAGTFYQKSDRENIFDNLFLVRRKSASCLDVIQHIMTAMQLTLSHWRGSWLVVSHMPYTEYSDYMERFRYAVTKPVLTVAGSMYNASTQITTADGDWIKTDSDYDILVGSKEGVLPAVASTTYQHINGGSASVFPRAQAHLIDVNYSDTIQFGAPHPNLGDFQPNQGGTSTASFPKEDVDIEVPEGSGFRLKGRLRLRVRNPRNDALNDADDPVTRVDEMIGAKIICSLKIKVGNRYLRQTITQTTESDFTDEADFGTLNIAAGATGANGDNDREYYPIEHGDAEWTTNSADRFEFMVLHPEFTQPAVETIVYDDENGIITEYPLGLYLKQENNQPNQCRYNSATYQEWVGESAIGSAIVAVLEGDNSGFSENNHPNPIIETEIDLQIPALPVGAGDQTGIEIDCSIKGYTAEGSVLYDTHPDNWPTDTTNYSWLGNVLVFTPAWIDFEFFVGDASRSHSPIYSAADDNPEGSEDIMVGKTVIGSRYDNQLGPLGFIGIAQFDENGDKLDAGTYALGWDSVSVPQDADKGILQVAANIAMDYRGSARRQFNLLLKPKPTSSIFYPIQVGSLFNFTRESMRLLIQRVDLELDTGVVSMVGVELERDPRNITEFDTTGDRGLVIEGGGLPPIPGGIVRSQRVFNENRLQGRSMKPAQVNKLSNITVTSPVNLDDLSDDVAANSADLATLTTGVQDLTTDVSNNDTDITNLDGSLTTLQRKIEGENLNLLGVFSDISDDTQASLKVTSTGADLRAGSNTAITTSQTSPGSIQMKVQAGATGSEAEVTAMTITGSSTVNTKATVNFPGGDFRVSSPSQFSEDVTFSGATNTITFTAGTSGIDYNDLDNLPSAGSGSASEALYVIDSTGGTDNVTATASTLTLDSTQFISNASNFSVGQNMVMVNMTMRACISFYVGFKDPNGADRTEAQAFLERSTDGGSTWSLVTGSNSFAYLRNGGNNDQDTATSGNIIMAVSSGDRFRVRVQTTGATLTTSTVANMSGFSIFDLLGGATGAAGADGADGSDALALAGNDQTLTGNRIIDVDGNYLQFKNGSNLRLQYDPNDDRFEFFNGLYVSGDFITATGGMTSGMVKFTEPQMGGTNGVILRGPTTNLSSDITFVLPDADGSNGQVLQTDGSGNLSFATVSGGSGGGMTQTPFFQISGRVQWSSSYAGRRMTMGNTSYGPFNWYLHSQIVNGTAQTYSASDAVDTTTKTMGNYYVYNAGTAMPSDSKKVRVKFAGRFNNQIANGSGTVGFSVWHCANMTSGSYTTNDTIRLIAKSADITPTTSSLVVWEEEFVSSTAYSGGRIMIFCEHRSGTLSSTAYCYGNWAVFLED